MENPIIDNRIIGDKTFAIRFLHFIEDVGVADACSFEEKESMINYAKKLIKYQCLTATDPNEIEYLKRVGAYQI